MEPASSQQPAAWQCGARVKGTGEFLGLHWSPPSCICVYFLSTSHYFAQVDAAAHRDPKSAAPGCKVGAGGVGGGNSDLPKMFGQGAGTDQDNLIFGGCHCTRATPGTGQVKPGRSAPRDPGLRPLVNLCSSRGAATLQPRRPSPRWDMPRRLPSRGLQRPSLSLPKDFSSPQKKERQRGRLRATGKVCPHGAASFTQKTTRLPFLGLKGCIGDPSW